MANALRFFQQYEPAIYFFLGIGALYYFNNFRKAWVEVREAIYGLEQSHAQRRLNQAIVALFVLFVLAFAVNILVSFIGPYVVPETIIPQGTPIPAVNSTVAVDASGAVGAENGDATATPLPTVDITTEGCIKDQIEISRPTVGESVSGEIQIKGTVNLDSFDFYKIEIAGANQALWITIQAGTGIVEDGVLVEKYDTSRLPPGGYVLQLVVNTGGGEFLPPCRIPITIGPSGD